MLPICHTCRAQLAAQRPVAGACFEDVGAAARLVRRAKIGDRRGLARHVARLAAARALELHAQRVHDVDLIAWVPADPLRHVHRGVNLPTLFAAELAARSGIPIVPMLRRRPGARQRGRTRVQRVSQQSRRFAPLHTAPATLARLQLRGVSAPRALVVDDVITTGATLAAASHELASIGFDTSTLAICSVPLRYPSAVEM